MRFLLSRGADCDLRTSRAQFTVDIVQMPFCGSQSTALQIASESSHVCSARKLLRAGAQVNVKSESGVSCLHGAITHAQRPMVALLLNQPGIDVDCQDNKGVTPLHIASDMGKEEYVQMLLAHGADISCKTLEGKTALDCAQEKNLLKIVALLEAAKTRCEACFKLNQSSWCGICKVVYYCNRECQRKHWPLHKEKCAKVDDMHEDLP